jgi:MoaA/NifB/PqqE/SkfB family radical SAM enzyme
MPNQYRYKILYLWKFIRTLTAGKLYNLYLNRHESRSLKAKLKSYPPQVIIDITNICNLKCPLCPTGMGITDRPKGSMSVDEFERIIDQLKGRTFAVHLYNWGEPLLLGNLHEYCNVAARKGFVVSVSSNLTMKLEDTKIEAMITSGLDRIIVSFDGVNSESYEKYRIGGNYARLRENLEKFVSIRKKARQKYPLLVLQMVRHTGNQDNIRFLRDAACDLGVDGYQIVDVLLPFGQGENKELIDKWITPDRLRNQKTPFDVRENELNAPCEHLWKYPVINSDSTMSPCCFVYSIRDDFAELKQQSFADAWNSANYLRARSAFRRKSEDGYLPCYKCSIYKSFVKYKREG